MKIIKNILITLGVIFLLFLVLAVFLGKGAIDFKADHEDFVFEYLAKFSYGWEPKDVFTDTTNEMISQMDSFEGQRYLSMFKRLGKLRSISDLEIQNYYSGTDGDSGIFLMKGDFENGVGVVTLGVILKNEKPMVQSLNINIPESLPLVQEKDDASI